MEIPFEPKVFTVRNRMPEASWLSRLTGRDREIRTSWGRAKVVSAREVVISGGKTVHLVFLDKFYLTEKDGEQIRVPFYGAVPTGFIDVGQQVRLFFGKGPGPYDVTLGISKKLGPTQLREIVPLMIFTVRGDGLVDTLNGLQILPEGGSLNRSLVETANELVPEFFN